MYAHNNFKNKQDIKRRLHELYGMEKYREFVNLINEIGLPYGDERLFFMYGKSCFKYGDVKTAQEIFENLMNWGNEKSKTLSRKELIKIYLRNKNTVSKAEKLATISFAEAKTKKDHDIASNYLAQIYAYKYDYQSAIDILKKAPDEINSYMMGIYYLNSHQYLDAEKWFLENLESENNHYLTNFHLGEVYFREKRYLDAKKQFARCLVLNPDKPMARIALGVLYRKTDNSIEARDELERALSMKTNRKEKSRIHLELGKLYSKMGFFDKAENYYLEALEYGAYKEAIYLALEDLYKKMGRNIDAAKMHEIGISWAEWSSYNFLNEEAEKSLFGLENTNDVGEEPKVLKM